MDGEGEADGGSGEREGRGRVGRGRLAKKINIATLEGGKGKAMSGNEGFYLAEKGGGEGGRRESQVKFGKV